MGIDVVVPLLLRFPLPLILHFPPLIPHHHRPPETCAAGPDPGDPLSVHGDRLRCHLPRPAVIVASRDPRHAMVLAAIEDAVAVAPLLPARNAAHGPSFLLVLRVLLLAVPSSPPNSDRDPPAPAIDLRAAVQRIGAALHVVPVARVLAVFPSSGDTRQLAG